MILPFDLSSNLEKLKERPLLIWHGEKDPVIPFSFASDFYGMARKNYSDEGKIAFSNAPGIGHKVNRAAMIEAADWFGKLISTNKG